MAEATTQERRSFRWRGLTSFVVTLAFLVLATTGVILYVSPQGRVANWTDWTVLGLDKEQWAAVHTTSALLFVIASAFHIYFNWDVLVSYVVRKRRLHLKRELAVAAAVVTVVFAGTAAGIPPFSNIADLNDRIKAHWESRSVQAPYPHAEDSRLDEFSEQTGTPLDVLVERLSRAGIKVDDPASQTLGDLARAQGLTPNELFAKISGESKSVTEGHGMGLGRLTVEVLCGQNGIPLEKALDILRREGYVVESGTTLKALAEQKGITPADIKDLIVENAAE